MSLVIRKFGSQNFTHETAGFEPYSSSDMVFVFDGNFLKIRSENGRIIFSRDGFRYNTVTVYDVGGSDETFTSVTDLQQRLIDLGHPAYDQGGGVIPGDYVSRIIAGTNVTVDPVGGTGTVTVNSTGGGGGANLEKDVNQTAHGFSEGDVVRLDGANYVLAQADAVANANAISFVTEVVDADNFKIQSESYISVNLGLSNGDEAFLSTTVAGGVQTTEPANGEVNVYLGQQTPQGFLISISTGFVVGSGGSGGVEIGGEYENNLQALNGGVGAGALYSLPSLGGNSETAVAQENPYQNRLTLIVNSTTEQRDVNIEINIHSTSGTNTTSDLYLNGNVRSDWSDIKFLDSSFNPIPWAMVDKESTKIKVAFKANLIEGDNTIYIDYNRTIASGDVLKLGVTTDIHYDDLETYVNRNQALTYIANYNAHMVAFQPDAYMDCGDKIGAVTATDSGRKVLMEAVDSALQTGADSLGVTKYPVAFGNHDFDDGMRASTTFGIYHGFPGQEDTDKLYGSFNLGGLTHISLDAQYKVGTNEHEDNSHKGYGYINELQLKWLEKTLEEATLPVVIWCHQSLAEFDTERVFLTKETYHVQNRTDVRAILEDSKKVILVMQGHTHSFMHNYIKGIPYVSVQAMCENPNNSNLLTWDPNPSNFSGCWSSLEIDKGTQVCRIREYRQSSSTVLTTRDVYIPFGITVYTESITNNHSETFNGKYTTPLEGSKCVVDSSQMETTQEGENAGTSYPPRLDLSQPKLTNTTYLSQHFATGISRNAFHFENVYGFLQVEFNFQQVNAERVVLKISDGGTGEANYLEIKDDLNVGIYDTGVPGYVYNASYVVGQWHSVKLLFDIGNQLVTGWFDGVQEWTDLPFFDSATEFINDLEFSMQTVGSTIAIDSFRITKYLETPPTITAVS